MDNMVTDKFLNYLKTVRKQAKVSTRELANVVGKTAMYISHLENGRVKTIKYNTAFEMLYFINRKQKFVEGNIDGDDSPEVLITDLLMNTFGIEPDEVLKQREEQAEIEAERVSRELEEIKNKLQILSSLVGYGDLELVNLLLKITKGNLKISLLDEVVDLLQDETLEGSFCLVIDFLRSKKGKSPRFIRAYNEEERRLEKALEGLTLGGKNTNG